VGKDETVLGDANTYEDAMWSRFLVMDDAKRSEVTNGVHFDCDKARTNTPLEQLQFTKLTATLHWTANIHRPYTIDIDLDVRTDKQYAVCSETHTGPAAVCAQCWPRLVAYARFFAAALHAMTPERCDRLAHPPLVCFSGNRGFHVYASGASGLHRLSKVRRARLTRQLATRFARHFNSAPSPIDEQASTAAGTEHLTRMPFSPHAKTPFACTPVPFEWLCTQSSSSCLTEGPDQFAIVWRQDHALFASFQQQTRVLHAVEAYTKWLAGFQKCE
jgi:hypothetical protein